MIIDLLLTFIDKMKQFFFQLFHLFEFGFGFESDGTEKDLPGYVKQSHEDWYYWPIERWEELPV